MSIEGPRGVFSFIQCIMPILPFLASNEFTSDSKETGFSQCKILKRHI